MSDDEPINFDPEEMVKFANKDVSLWTAVHEVMSQPAVRRTGTAVLRAKGKKPSILDAADIEPVALEQAIGLAMTSAPLTWRGTAS